MARKRSYIVNLTEQELKFAKLEKNKVGNTTVRKRYEILIAAHKYPELSYKEIGHKAGVS